MYQFVTGSTKHGQKMKSANNSILLYFFLYSHDSNRSSRCILYVPAGSACVICDELCFYVQVTGLNLPGWTLLLLFSWTHTLVDSKESVAKNWFFFLWLVRTFIFKKKCCSLVLLVFIIYIKKIIWNKFLLLLFTYS